MLNAVLSLLRSLPFAILFMASCAVAQSVTPSDEIEVEVQKDGDLVRIAIELTVDATRKEAWDVLTDYNSMASFVPAVESSVILKREGNELEVAQKGKATRGPLTFPFENVRRIALIPMQQIYSRIVSGDLAPSEVTTTLDGNDGATRVRVKGVYAPRIWVPPVIGPAIIAAETKEQWQVFRKEILSRRHN
jgi:carbon monoxide dehydrogenase subunit G